MKNSVQCISYQITSFTYFCKASLIEPQKVNKTQTLYTLPPTKNSQTAQLEVSPRHTHLPNSHLSTKEAFYTSTMFQCLILHCSLHLQYIPYKWSVNPRLHGISCQTRNTQVCLRVWFRLLLPFAGGLSVFFCTWRKDSHALDV